MAASVRLLRSWSSSLARSFLPRIYERTIFNGGYTTGLAACGPQLSLLRTYKVRASLKLLCSGCRFVKRKGKLRVVCSKKPRHKQKQ